MKNNLKQIFFTVFALVVIFLSSCSKDKPLTPEEEVAPVKGVYILNEGDFMTPESSSLSYLDFSTDKLTKNIFSANNNNLSLGNGLVDMDIYGNLLFITATESNKVEVLNASTAKVVKTIQVKKPRFIAFYKGKAFITTYEDKVVVIDTLTNTVTNEILVGRTPEHIVTLGDKLYVANSGSGDGITGGKYDNTISIINPNTLKEEDKIKVADNVYHLFTDGKVLFANTMDVYEGVWPNSTLAYPSKLYKINTTMKEIEKAFDFGVLKMDFYQNQNLAVFISNNKLEDGKVSTNLYAMGLKTLNPEKQSIIDSEKLNFPQFPYALSINQENGDLWYANSDFTSDGEVFHYKNGTNEMKKYTVGLNPSVIVFN